MDTLEIRVWNKHTKEMLYGAEVEFKNDSPMETEDTVAMLYTGQLDINGKKIYSGDIVQPPVFTDKLAVVVYKSASFLGRSVKPVFKNIQDDSKYEWLSIIYFGYKPTIVGNIYENPELLK